MRDKDRDETRLLITTMSFTNLHQRECLGRPALSASLFGFSDESRRAECVSIPVSANQSPRLGCSRGPTSGRVARSATPLATAKTGPNPDRSLTFVLLPHRLASISANEFVRTHLSRGPVRAQSFTCSTILLFTVWSVG